MRSKLQPEIGATVRSPDNGPGIVTSIDLVGQKWLVQFEAGRSWVTETQLAEWERQESKTTGSGGKAAALILLLSLLGGLFDAVAQPSTTGYVSAQDLSSSTNWAEVVFPGAATKQIVLKQFDVQSDSATNETWIIGGTRPVPIHYSLNNTQLIVLTNSLIGTNQLAIVQMNGSTNQFVVNILYTNQLTNVVVGGPGPVLAALSIASLGSLTNTNGILWLCTNRFRIWPGVGLLSRSGESLFSAQVRAPLAIRTGSITGPAGGVSNQVRNATVLYRE